MTKLAADARPGTGCYLTCVICCLSHKRRCHDWKWENSDQTALTGFHVCSLHEHTAVNVWGTDDEFLPDSLHKFHFTSVIVAPKERLPIQAGLSKQLDLHVLNRFFKQFHRRVVRCLVFQMGMRSTWMLQCGSAVGNEGDFRKRPVILSLVRTPGCKSSSKNKESEAFCALTPAPFTGLRAFLSVVHVPNNVLSVYGCFSTSASSKPWVNAGYSCAVTLT